LSDGVAHIITKLNIKYTPQGAIESHEAAHRPTNYTHRHTHTDK